MSAVAHLFDRTPERARLVQPAASITYLGMRMSMRFDVIIVPGHEPLPPRLDLANHSRDGFSWGYEGSGPAQLALALLAHATREADVALAHHQSYKRDVIAGLDQDRGWKLTAGDVRAWVAHQRRHLFEPKGRADG